MNMRVKAAGMALILVAGAALAKDGVKNPVVKERMDLMQTIRANAGILGDMAAGKAPFDAAKAAGAKEALAAAATQIPAKFEPEESDPVSEALPDIWMAWDDFTTDADRLHNAAMSMDPTSLDTLRAGMANVGGACKECHTQFRM